MNSKDDGNPSLGFLQYVQEIQTTIYKSNMTSDVRNSISQLLDILVEVNAVADLPSLEENRCTLRELNNIVPMDPNPGPQGLLI